jgi:hypothetical protein
MLVLVLTTGSALLATAATTVVPAAIAAARGPQASSVSRSFTIYTTVKQADFTDQGTPGFSLGDQDIFTDDVLTRKGGKKIGLDGGVCTAVRIASPAYTGTLQCQITYSLPGGEIMTQSLVHIARGVLNGRHREAITGGTGRYDGASGQTMVNVLSASVATDHFMLK